MSPGMTSLPDLAVDVDHANFRLGNEVFEAAGALFVRNIAIPDIYDANHVAAVRARTPQELEALFEAAEREFPNSRHRRYIVDHRTPPEFNARLLLEGGYGYSTSLCLVLEGELAGKAPACDIRPMTSKEDWQACLRLTREDFKEHRERINEPDPGDQVALHLWESKRTKQPPVQYWLAFVDGQPVGYFNSWEGIGGMGQVEDLYVTPAFRKRGIATALIQHCVAQARKAGAGPILIVADPTDTPKQIYVRMGFRPVAIVGQYLKKLD